MIDGTTVRDQPHATVLQLGARPLLRSWGPFSVRGIRPPSASRKPAQFPGFSGTGAGRELGEQAAPPLRSGGSWGTSSSASAQASAARTRRHRHGRPRRPARPRAAAGSATAPRCPGVPPSDDSHSEPRHPQGAVVRPHRAGAVRPRLPPPDPVGPTGPPATGPRAGSRHGWSEPPPRWGSVSAGDAGAPAQAVARAGAPVMPDRSARPQPSLGKAMVVTVLPSCL